MSKNIQEKHHHFLECLDSVVKFFGRHVDAVNDLNVFPVPDGDTGTNMHRTLVGIRDRVCSIDVASYSDLLDQISGAALYEGRGNSGVILAQIIMGVCEGVRDFPTLDSSNMTYALKIANERAQQAVAEPVPGTMLTVLSDVTRTANEVTAGVSLTKFVEMLLLKAVVSVDETPCHLEVLKSARVVDAGGYGLEVILRALLVFMEDKDPMSTNVVLRKPEGEEPLSRQNITLFNEPQDGYGYCTQFIINDSIQDLECLKRGFQELGDSLVISGTKDLYRIHLHADDPGVPISKAAAIGSVSEVKVENMQRQVDALSFDHHTKEDIIDVGDKTAVIPIINGKGIRKIFLDWGACVAIDGGDSMNPSVAEIHSVLSRVKASSILLITNNSAIIPAAVEAANIIGDDVCVLKTKTIPQGIECMIEFDANIDAQSNAEVMERIIPLVRTIMICPASRAIDINGLRVELGQPVGFLDGEISSTAENPVELLCLMIEMLHGIEMEQITVLIGNDRKEDVIPRVERELKDRITGIDHENLQILLGDQPHYDFIVSILEA